MKIAGTYTFPATREEVWSAINDPEVLARTIPGCQKLEQVGENEFESTLKIGLQAVKGVYSGKVRLEDVQEPQHYKIVLDGKGTNGFVQGEGTVDLAEEGGSTKLTYGGEAQVGGTIASVGQRLIDGAAKTLINQSLKALTAQIEARRQQSSSNGATEQAAAKTDETASSDGAESAPAAATESRTDAPTTDAQNAAAAADSEQALMAVSEPSSATPSAEPDPQSSALPAAPATFERRSIVVPEGEGLSEADVARGVVMDFYNERPWLPWVIVAFLLGYLFGRGK